MAGSRWARKSTCSLRLHPFGHNAQAKLAGNGQDGLYQGAVVPLLGASLTNERSIFSSWIGRRLRYASDE